MATSTNQKKGTLTEEEWQIIAVAGECHLYKKREKKKTKTKRRRILCLKRLQRK